MARRAAYTASLPVQRWENLWSSLVRAGDIRYTLAEIDRGVVLSDTRLEGKNVLGMKTMCYGDVSIGYATTIGRYNVLRGGKIRVGRYTQIGPNVSVYCIYHSTTHMTSYVNNTLFEGRMKQHMLHGEVVIGSDVWIGHGAIILNGVAVGDGAVIGAGAIVTKDVPPYGVVGGNPAKVLRARFPEEIQDVLLRLRWWDLTPESLARAEPLFHLEVEREPQRFVELVEEFMASSPQYRAPMAELKDS